MAKCARGSPDARSGPKSRPLTWFAWVSIAAAMATIGLKTVAYLITGSVGLLSDAVESGVNLVGGFLALAMLTVAARPADEDHAYGHSKAEYFSSGVEGTLILIAATSIAVVGIQRLVTPRALEQVGIGLVVCAMAALINLGVAVILLRAGRARNSITLEANAHHLLTDVWTSAGVILGVGAVAVTGWVRLDPVLAILVAANIVRTGVGIVYQSILGLMDTALPAAQRALIDRALEPYRRQGIQFHALRTRQSGARRFASIHVLVPGDWTVQRGHSLLDRIESNIREILPETAVFTHLESLDDPASWEDIDLEGGAGPKPASDVPPGPQP